jgi:hypothetical protein
MTAYWHVMVSFPQNQVGLLYKNLECENEEGRRVTIQGIQNPVLVRQISALQGKKYCIKGCPLYAIQVLNSIENDKPSLENHPILREYKCVY